MIVVCVHLKERQIEYYEFLWIFALFNMQIANYANSRLTRNKKVKDQIVSKLESDLQYVIIFKSLNTSNNIYNIGLLKCTEVL